MATLQEMHQNGYSDLPFDVFAQRVHQTHYSDMPFADFMARAGVRPEASPMQNRVADAFTGNQMPERIAPLAEATQRRADQMAPQAGVGRQMFSDLENTLTGAGQRTAPQTSAYGAPLATRVTQGDDGNLYFRDQATGAETMVDRAKHVVLRDANSQELRVYPRTDRTNESTFSAIGRLLGIGAMAPSNVAPTAVGATQRAAPVARRADDVLAAAQRQGVNLPRAVTSDSMPVQQTANVLSNTPFSGTPIVRATENAAAQLGQRADEVATSIGASTREAAGQQASRSITDWITGRSKEITNRVYDAVDTAIRPNVAVPLDNTRNVASRIISQNQAAALPPGDAVGVIFEAMQRPQGMTYEGIKRLRTRVGEMLEQGILPPNISKTDLKAIYGGLTDDLRRSIELAGGPRGVALWERANRINVAVQERRETLARIVGTRGDAPAETVFERLRAAATEGGRGNLEMLRNARRAMQPNEWDEVAGTVVQRLGRDPEGNLSPLRFVTEWGKLSPEGRSILFSGPQGRAHAQALQDISTISTRAKQFQRFGNPSGTARSTIGAGIGGGLLADPMTTLSAALGGRVLSEFLARPASARATASWSRAFANVQARPTAQSMAAFQAASRALSSETGGRVTADQFMRLLGSVPKVNAQGEEQDNPR